MKKLTDYLREQEAQYKLHDDVMTQTVMEVIDHIEGVASVIDDNPRSVRAAITMMDQLYFLAEGRRDESRKVIAAAYEILMSRVCDCLTRGYAVIIDGRQTNDPDPDEDCTKTTD